MAKKFSVEFKMIRVDLLETNQGQIRGVPKNPRFIRDKRFEALKQSIADDPEFMQVRELIVYPLYTGKYCIVGGNMRFRAAKELGMTNFPCKVIPAGLDSKKIRAFVIKDNIAFGQDDVDLLGNDWEIEELASFGMEGFEKDLEALNADDDSENANERKLFKEEETDSDTDSENAEPVPADGVPDLVFPSNNDWGIPTPSLDMQATSLEAPFMSFGYKRGWRELAKTLHFYIDDWRFDRIWNRPDEILGGGITAVVEPNYSVSHITPRAFAMWCFFRKRWLNCFWQSQGLKTFVDLNVPPNLVKLALTGVPKGWKAYFTRGIKGNEDWITEQFKHAQKLSGVENPLFVVYGGGKIVEKFCKENSLIYLSELHKTEEYQIK